MVRVKGGVHANKRKRNILKQAKGFRWTRSNCYVAAKQALMKAWEYAYIDRKKLKRVKRQLWQIQINAACRAKGISYSKFMGALKKQNIEVDRKILSELARNNPEIFDAILAKAK